MNPRVFREYDIRGHGESDFTDDFVADLGRAVGAFLADKGARRITLGRDCRLTSPRIHATMKRELLASGLDVIDVGIVHTPALYFSVFHLEADGGVMITASHNPAPDNGFKIVSSRSSRARPRSTARTSRSCASASSSAPSAPAPRLARRPTTTS
jgi:phosphomannomutase / phosphoglucomutase